MGEIYAKSCERMEELADGGVALTVTSPPYWNAIDYRRHLSDPEANYRHRPEGEFEEYLAWLGHCFGECLRVTRPGGFLAAVVGTVLLDGRHYPLPHRLVVLMEEMGWRFHQDITWYKVTGGVKRAGLAIKHPYPGYFYPNIMTEQILIFRRPGERVYRNRTPREKEEARLAVDTLFKHETANNIWHVAPVPPGQYPHPCPFPEEIPYRLITLYSYPGDVVLDPFLGIGTTAKVARHLDRDYVGYEVEEAYVRAARERLAEPLRLRDPLLCRFVKLSRWDDGDGKPARNRRAPRGAPVETGAP